MYSNTLNRGTLCIYCTSVGCKWSSCMEAKIESRLERIKAMGWQGLASNLQGSEYVAHFTKTT